MNRSQDNDINDINKNTNINVKPQDGKKSQGKDDNFTIKNINCVYNKISVLSSNI